MLRKKGDDNELRFPSERICSGKKSLALLPVKSERVCSGIGVALRHS